VRVCVGYGGFFFLAVGRGGCSFVSVPGKTMEQEGKWRIGHEARFTFFGFLFGLLSLFGSPFPLGLFFGSCHVSITFASCDCHKYTLKVQRCRAFIEVGEKEDVLSFSSPKVGSSNARVKISTAFKAACT
jgi:hypothetical protein